MTIDHSLHLEAFCFPLIDYYFDFVPQSMHILHYYYLFKALEFCVLIIIAILGVIHVKVCRTNL